MHKILEWIRKNRLFLWIAVLVAAGSFAGTFAGYLGENPFASEKVLDNPVRVYEGADSRYFIADSSEKIYVTDRNNRIRYVMESDGTEDTFAYAEAVVEDEAGHLYVHDREYADSGSKVCSERILMFSGKGKLIKTVYEEDTLNKDKEQILSLEGLGIRNGKVCFAVVSEDGIRVYTLIGSRAEECGFMPLEQAYGKIVDVSISDDMDVAVAFKNGDVTVWSDQTAVCVYDADKHDTQDYVSLVSEVSYGKGDVLYLCDVGLREVKCLTSGYQREETVISRGSFATLKDDEFAQQPIYTGLEASENHLSVLVSEYVYRKSTDEEIYTYRLAQVANDGELVFCSGGLQIPASDRILGVAVYVAAGFVAVMLIYAAVRAVRLLRRVQLDKSVKVQLIMVITALGVTIGVSYVIFDSCNKRFINEAADKLLNVSYLVGKSVDSEILEEIQCPDDYAAESYSQLDKSVKDVIHNKVNEDSGLYCVIYKVKNDVVYEAYRDDNVHGVMYPMAGRYRDSIEEYIAAENDYDVSYQFALSEGTYMYALVPVYDEEGSCLAFVETGMDYEKFHQDNQNLYSKVLMAAVMAVIIVVLLLSEFLYGYQAFSVRRRVRKERGSCPSVYIRPLSFLFFVIANMSTAFLPIYGMELWNEQFPIGAEIAAALPLTAEMTCAAVAAFVCGYFIRRTGVRMTCIFGALFYVLGNIISAFSVNLWMLITANALCGVGSGLLTIAFNSWAAGYEDETEQNRGFIHINAAYLAGLNCGTVIGSLIWDKFGIAVVYYVSAALSVALIALSVCFAGKIKVVSEMEEASGGGRLKDLFTPAVIRFFLFISVPYLICTAFLEYFFPIEAERNGLSATHISMAFLLSGFISIYIGSSLAEPVTRKLGVKKAMVLASFLYAAALWYLVMNPSVFSCYVVVVFFAVADSFGLSAQAVYYSSLPEVKRVGQSKALGVNSTVESVTSACGSLVFGLALMLGTRRGILVIAAVFALFLFLFMLGERRTPKE